MKRRCNFFFVFGCNGDGSLMKLLKGYRVGGGEVWME